MCKCIILLLQNSSSFWKDSRCHKANVIVQSVYPDTKLPRPFQANQVQYFTHCTIVYKYCLNEILIIFFFVLTVVYYWIICLGKLKPKTVFTLIALAIEQDAFVPKVPSKIDTHLNLFIFERNKTAGRNSRARTHPKISSKSLYQLN